MKRLLYLAGGTATGGGSGFANCVLAARRGELSANIVGVISNHPNGGVARHAKAFGIEFFHMPGPWYAEKYIDTVKYFEADFVALSGWMKPVRGLNPRTTFNIHPGPLPRFGGKGMYGHHVHEAVMEAYKAGEVMDSAVTMHFVTDEYDAGPVFMRQAVAIRLSDDAESLGAHVNTIEHQLQPIATDMVVNGEIHWDGTNPSSLVSPLLGRSSNL